jgi:uncharacterized protein (TIGR02391 family)
LAGGGAASWAYASSRLEERARRQFILGEFEAAALVAMREVEIAVRERAGLPPTMLGTDLMNKAFAEHGPLTDVGAPKAEQAGLRSLYRGAISVFKNPASHRRVSYDDLSRPQRLSCSLTSFCA